MKNSIKRILSFALMLSLLVGMMAGFSAFAAETETVEIVSKNVYYEDTLNLMYAVNSTSDDVVVNVYTADGTLVETIDEYEVDAVKYGIDAKVFISKIGVPAQDIDTVFYAEAVAGNTKSATVKYSVLEYLYERLYVSENVTAEETTMYKSLLAFADAADVVVNKDTTTNIAKYAYVRVTNGTVDGTNTAAMVLAGTALDKITTTVTPGTGMKLAWNVTVDNVTKTVENVAEYVTEAGKAYTFTATEVEDEGYVEEETFVDVTASVVIDEYATANGWVNTTQYTKVDINALVTAIAAYDLEDSHDNTGKFYDNGRNWRFYQNEDATLTISAGNYNIVSVTVTYVVGNTGTLTLDGEAINSATAVSVGAPSVTFGVGNTGTATNGNVQISKIEVVYQVPEHDCAYTEPTCTTPATCTICGAINGDKLPHTYDEGVANPEATCTTAGIMVYTCSCGHKKTEDIDVLGHTTEQGTCERCGKEIGGSSAAEKVTASKTMKELISANGWTDSTTKQSFELDDVVTVKVDGGQNSGKAYNGDHIRIYATDTPAGTLTISVADGYELVSIKITTKTGTYAYLKVAGLGNDISNVLTEVSGSSVVVNSVKNGSNGKQVQVLSIEVVYQAK